MKLRYTSRYFWYFHAMPDSLLSDEDKALFQKEMLTVKPLHPTKIAPSLRTPPQIQTRHRPKEQPVRVYALSDYYTQSVGSEELLSYTKHSIPKKRFRQLKLGEIKWHARLDLHGLKPKDAELALCKFVDEQYHIGHRGLLIIHGKGGQLNNAPILKNLVNHWLKQIPTVLAFHSAMPKDGGTGALYVLLTR